VGGWSRPACKNIPLLPNFNNPAKSGSSVCNDERQSVPRADRHIIIIIIIIIFFNNKLTSATSTQYRQ